MSVNLENSAVATGLGKVSLHSNPKESNPKECSNYCTIALISYASKVMLKILQARLQQYVNHELLDFFSIYFYQLEANYFTILWWFLPYIGLNQPWIYIYSPSWSPLPPPSPPDPSGSSQCTSPEQLSHASNLTITCHSGWLLSKRTSRFSSWF